MNTPSPHPRYIRARSYAPPPQTPGPPPKGPLPLLPPPVFDDDEDDSSLIQIPADTWADETKLFSTIRGALSLSADALKALQKVPRENGRAAAAAYEGQPVTRTRAQIAAGQRVDFAFCTGSRALRRHGMPMYALANASEEEVSRNMGGGSEAVGALLQLRRIRVRFEVRFQCSLREGVVV